MSLVADYTDSEEEEEEEKQETIITDSNQSKSSCSKALRNPFGVNNDDGEEDSFSSDSSDEEVEKVKEKKVGDGEQLDNPFRFFGSANVENSVLRVEFREQEAKKTAVLERHVKLSQEIIAGATTINGKKICWNNRKGRCRFGHNCKFAHDTDSAVIDPDSVQIKLPDKNFQPVQPEQIPTQFKKRNPFCMDNVDWDSETPVVLSSLAQLSGGDGGGGLKKGDDDLLPDDDRKTKKKRPGLASGLNPSKKVMKMYYSNKEKEQS